MSLSAGDPHLDDYNFILVRPKSRPSAAWAAASKPVVGSVSSLRAEMPGPGTFLKLRRGNLNVGYRQQRRLSD